MFRRTLSGDNVSKVPSNSNHAADVPFFDAGHNDVTRHCNVTKHQFIPDSIACYRCAKTKSVEHENGNYRAIQAYDCQTLIATST